jgi:hypothetical protein
MHTCLWYAVAKPLPVRRLVHDTITTVAWTEPVRYWRKACLNHTVILQKIMAMSPLYTPLSCSRTTLEGREGPRPRTPMTTIEYINDDGRYLNPIIVWLANTYRSNWTAFPTPGWQYACSDSGYTDSRISLEWLKRIFDPEANHQSTPERGRTAQNNHTSYAKRIT